MIAYADPIQWTVGSGGNGHYYEVLLQPSGICWDDAKALAESRIYLGHTGYLATATLDQENTFIADSMNTLVHTALIGGYQPAGSPEPAGGWTWITGESWAYTNWISGGPNNNGNENSLTIFASDHPLGWGRLWNDIAEDNASPLGYIVEYTPEPATLSLLALGGLALLRRRKR